MEQSAEERKILVIDDDVELCDLVGEFLQAEGFSVACCQDGIDGAETAIQGDFQLVVLDVMLPRLNGFDVLRRIRTAGRTPVIMLTARGDDIDRIVGLELGADDYLPKPFNPRELVARIHAILRRSRPSEEKRQKLAHEDVVVDSAARSVKQGGKLLELTSVEFELLVIFLSRLGVAIDREELVKQVLGRSFTAYDRSIDMHVSNLRRKLGPRTDGGDRIQSIRGIGYMYTSSEA